MVKSNYLKKPYKKILFIGPFDRGGISTINRQVIDLVNESGKFKWEKINTTPYREFSKLLGYMMLYLITFLKLLTFRSNIVYLQISQTGFFHQSLFLLIAKVFSCRTIAHFHAKPIISTTLTKTKFNHVLWGQRYIDELIVLAESSKLDLVKAGWKKPIHIIPNFVDASEYPENLVPFDQRECILYLGSMSEMKGIFKILDVAAIIPAEKFVFIGRFEDKRIERYFMTRAAGLRNVTWLGPIYGNEKNDYLNNAKFLILPSVTEVFPMTIIECSICGAIPLATPVGIIPSLISHGENGFLIDADTPDQTAVIIRELLKNPTRAQEISLNCRQEVCKKFTKSVIGKRLLTIIHAN